MPDIALLATPAPILPIAPILKPPFYAFIILFFKFLK
jgi:hypothetical protein